MQKSILSHWLIKLLKMYQRISRYNSKPCCRFYPSCSSYALEALHSYNFLIATSLILKRLLKCQPLCKAGVDFLPQKVVLGPFVWRARPSDQ